ncbi:MAG: DNA topoisomerase IB [Betaproteobacteria bacterium]
MGGAPCGVALPDGLVHVGDGVPGIRRVRRGACFAYRGPDGRWIVDATELARIRALAVPPAWTDVWICPRGDGHLQATGRDARGRKQYRYHPRFRALREETKFDRLVAFGRALPRIRARVDRDLRGGRGALSRELVLATVVRLLDTTFARVGNEEYTRANGSYGLTTLRSRHAGVRGGTLRLAFRGKSGVVHGASVDDPVVARVVRRCQQLPGQELFRYEEADGALRSVGSADVNDYLAEAAGERFTAKDFRTWHGSVQALELLRRGVERGEGSTRGLAVQVVADVAHRLGNTPAVCRKAYIHPEVLDLAQAGADDAARRWQALAAPRVRRGLDAAESRLLALLAETRRRERRGLADTLRRSLATSTRRRTRDVAEAGAAA